MRDLRQITGLLQVRAGLPAASIQRRPPGPWPSGARPGFLSTHKETTAYELTRPAAPAPALEETPTMFAEPEIQVGPAQPWQTVDGKVPPDQANHLISTFGALGSAIAGIAGAVLTFRIDSGLTGPGYAELALALVSAVLAARWHPAARREGGRTDTAAGRAGRERPERPGMMENLLRLIKSGVGSTGSIKSTYRLQV